jgi:hypothetical protein
MTLEAISVVASLVGLPHDPAANEEAAGLFKALAVQHPPTPPLPDERDVPIVAI